VSGAEATLLATGAAWNGFRPTHVQFVVDGVVPSIKLMQIGKDLASATNYVSGTPLAIVGQTTDIYSWSFFDWTGIHYTDILFYCE
jgi:hypothetical protein